MPCCWWSDGTQTTAADLRACERMFQGRVPLLGVVLNRAQDRGGWRGCCGGGAEGWARSRRLDDLIGMILRRRRLIAAGDGAGHAGHGAGAAGPRAVVWEAVAVLQVQSSTVGEDGTPAAGPSTAAAQRLQAIEQRLTTRASLLAVIDRHGLYRDLPLTEDEKVLLLRQSLRFQTVASVAQAAYGAPPLVSALADLCAGRQRRSGRAGGQ
jgi:uncharacterized protein involved in exopolysaccharide biosynthesis